jgi:acetylornithine deacetylase
VSDPARMSTPRAGDASSAAAAGPVAAAVVEEIRARQDELVELAAELIGFDTTARAAPGEQARDELALQEMLAQRLGAIGAETELFEPDPEPLRNERQMLDGIDFRGRPQLVATWLGEGGGDGGDMLLNGHIDVVPSGPSERWSSDPFVGEVRGGELFGRGACDMKGGIAAMVFAVETLAALGVRLAGDVIVNTVTDEESSGAGSLACALRGVRADACIVPEPTGLDLWLGCRGTCLATIEIEGRPAHVEIPQEHWSQGGGVNAIDKALVVLGALEGISQEWASRPAHRHPHLSPGHISPVRVEAGDWPVTIPSRCEIDCDVTFLPCQADDDGWDSLVRAEVETWIAAIAACDPWLAQHPPRISWTMATPPLEVSEREPIVTTLVDALGRVGREARFSGLDSWYDGATFARIHGIPAVGFGPGSINVAHAIDEHVPVAELVDCSAAIALALIDHCGLAG